ncbi:MAG: decaprenyl-phosphate phosphoribosyltransferase [Muribaculaceae bacterium]|nr:decaprenyl-phosphate phosphoribosyltransferase [Muribaculaceae bacterium]
MVGSFISLIRPFQWVKNVFVLVPLFFGGQLLNGVSWEEALITFAAFCFMASAVYCLNDLCDIKADRRHPGKCSRPLASGRLKPANAVVLMLLMVLLSFAVNFSLNGDRAGKVAVVLLVYMALNVAYCCKLKHYAIVDVFIIALGFVLRLVAGGVACDIWLSPWIVLMTFLIALFLAFAKRRDDVVLYEDDRIVTRKNVIRYNLPFMNQTLGLLGAITIVCYIMYSVSPEVTARFNHEYVYATSIFVLAAILRYLQVTMVDLRSGNPTTVLLHDRFIQLCVVLWMAYFFVILYV